MDKVAVSCTVLFQEPYWIGLVERFADNTLSVSRVVFGAEPKDYEVYMYLLDNHQRLRFSPAVEAAVKEIRMNPKRRQRCVHRQVEHNGIGTKSQQALKLQQEQVKTERRLCCRERSEAIQQRKFEQKQQKRKEKHRGR